jgi:site-specific recombinase
VFLIASGVATALSVHHALDASEGGQAALREKWTTRHAPAFYHRRYVVPRTDLDENVQPLWARAVAAANQIRDSDVVRRHLIDSAEATAHLPQRLWEIAEGLARLSLARRLQRDILRQAGTQAGPKAGSQAGTQAGMEAWMEGPQVAAKVSHQGREMDLAAATIEERVRRLEDSASLVKKADEVKRMEATLGRLGEVDELLLDLRASTPDARPDLDPTERLRLEAQAVIDQASEAVRSLAYPDTEASPG